jgi:hypothetical protein
VQKQPAALRNKLAELDRDLIIGKLDQEIVQNKKKISFFGSTSITLKVQPLEW